MKKFLSILSLVMFMVVSSFTLTSCDSLKFGVVYSVSVDGDGDGNFKVTFPQGSYAMDGTAALSLYVGDSIPLNSVSVTSKSDVLQKGNKKELAAMKAVNDSIAELFQVFEGTGTYDITLHGIVKETATGLSFEVNRHFSNREDPLRTRKIVQDDLYPYIE